MISVSRVDELAGAIDWYATCRTNAMNGVPVRGLDEAQSGYIYALAALQALAADAESLRTALAQAVAEIEQSPYAGEPWGWGIAYRLPEWRAAIKAAK